MCWVGLFDVFGCAPSGEVSKFFVRPKEPLKTHTLEGAIEDFECFWTFFLLCFRFEGDGVFQERQAPDIEDDYGWKARKGSWSLMRCDAGNPEDVKFESDFLRICCG